MLAGGSDDAAERTEIKLAAGAVRTKEDRSASDLAQGGQLDVPTTECPHLSIRVEIRRVGVDRDKLRKRNQTARARRLNAEGRCTSDGSCAR